MGVRDGFPVDLTGGIGFTVVAVNGPVTAQVGQLIDISAGNGPVTAPAAMVAGQCFGVCLDNSAPDCIIKANTGQTIDGLSQISNGNAGGPVGVQGYPQTFLMIALDSTRWISFTRTGSDAAMGMMFWNSLKIAGGLSILSKFIGANYTTTGFEAWIRRTSGGAITITLTAPTLHGSGIDGFLMISNDNGNPITLTPATGTIDYTVIAPRSSVILGVNPSGQWVHIARSGRTNTSRGMTLATTAPVSGTAFTPSLNSDAEVYIPVTAGANAGTVTITYGPTVGNENTLYNALNFVANQDTAYNVRVPATWLVIVTITGATAAIGTTTIQPC